MLSLWNHSDVPDHSHSSTMCKKNGVQQTREVRAMATAKAAVLPSSSFFGGGGDVGAPLFAQRNIIDWAKEFCLDMWGVIWWLDAVEFWRCTGAWDW